MKRALVCLLAVLLLGLGSCSSPDPALSKEARITLALNWLPEAEHGGYYAAMLNGDFEAAGLDVEIQPGGPDSPVIQRVGASRVTFGIANADRIALGQLQGADVVGVLAPLQHSPRCIMVHEESGIETFQQLENVTLAMSDAPAFSYYLKSKLPLKNVRIVRYTGSIAPFLREERYAQQGYVFSEPIIARREGAHPRSLMLSDLGYDPYTSVLITHRDEISKRPEMVRKFVEAARKGWERYLADPTQVHEYLQTINPEMTQDVLDEGQKILKTLAVDEQGQFVGGMQPERWETLVKQLEEIQLLDAGVVQPGRLFTLDFLPQE